MFRPRSTHRPVVVAGALIMLAVATTACASKSGSSAASSGAIHLGLMADYTGAQSYLGPDMQSGARTAITAINAAGGVMGRQLDLSTGDTVGDPVDAIPAFRKMISANHVAAVVGPTSNEGPALLPIAKSSKIPMFLQGGTTALDHETNPFYFRTTVGDGTLGKAMAAYATTKHLMKAAFAFTTSTAAQTLVAPIKQAYTAKGGSVVAEVQLVPSASSYRSQIQTLMAAKPDVVFLQQDPQTAGTFFHQAAELGFDNKTTWVGSDTEMSEDIFKALGSSLATVNFYFAHGSVMHDAALAAFTTAYKQQTGKDQFLTFAPESYDATNLIALAMEKAKTTDGDAVRKAVLEVSSPSPGAVAVSTFAEGRAALAQGKSINYEGVASNDDFDQWHNVAGPFVISTWSKDGKVADVLALDPSQLG
jgi:ABC-type branched-subunit amino acid transport system substrate-binding protein